MVLVLKYGRQTLKGVAPPMNILIVDDHVLIREALRGVLQELQPEAEVKEAADARRAMERITENPDLDLILLDLKLPDRSGFEVLAELRECHPAIAVVMLSASNDPDHIAKALGLGAVGFIPKSAQRDVMLGALRLIFSGGIYIPPEILSRPPAAQSPAPGTSAPSGCRASAAELGLTGRQKEVLALMMQGKSNKAICRALDLAEPTVKNHVTAILKALKAANRTEAVVTAGALGVAPPPAAG